MLCELVHLLCTHRGRVMDHYCGTRNSLISCIYTGRQRIRIENTSDTFNAALQRLFGLMPSKKRPETASKVVRSAKFEETVKTSDTDANLVLNTSSQPSSWCTQGKENTEQEKNAEADGTTEDTARIIGHPGLVAK